MREKVIKISKIIFVPIICLATFSFINFWLIPLIFCFIIVVFNLKILKLNTIIIFLVASYISFLVSILLYSVIGYMLELLLGSEFFVGKWRIVDISYLIILGIISPILFFYFNSFILKSLSFKNNLFKIFLSKLIISLGLFLSYTYGLDIEYSFMLWQFVVSLVLQLIIYQNFKKVD